jgi:predicted nucleic acid-binding protein
LTVAGPEETAVSVVALAELRYGANCSAKPQGNHQAIDDFTSGLAVLGVDAQVARVFGEIKAQLRQAGKLIEDLDWLSVFHLLPAGTWCGATLAARTT